MTVVVDFSGPLIALWWVCDACACESAPRGPEDEQVPLGWSFGDHDGTRWHACGPCRITSGLDAGWIDLAGGGRRTFFRPGDDEVERGSAA